MYIIGLNSLFDINTIIVMKIFVKGIKLIDININKLNIQSDITHSTTNYINLFSLEGIYKVNSGENCLSLCKYMDGVVKEIKINNYDLIIDTSKIEYLNDVSHIPYNYVSKHFQEHSYKLSKKSDLRFIILYDNSSISDFYFEYNGIGENIDDKINNAMFKEDFMMFLSLIK